MNSRIAGEKAPSSSISPRPSIRGKLSAIGIAPDDLGRICVSSEYPIYRVDASVTDARYIQLLFRTDFFRRKINSMISGASGRKRVQPSELESVEVPLPPLDVQRSIVAAWEQSRQDVADIRRRISELDEQIEADFLAALGLSKPKQSELPKVFAVWSQGFHRWSVLYNQLSAISVDLTQGKYPVLELNDALSYVQYGSSTKANTLEKGTPMIRMNNVVDGMLILSDLKHVELPEHERQHLLLHEGDILFNRTNSKELVGKCAVFHERGEYVFASYLIRLRADLDIADPDYLAFVLNSTVGRQQVDMLSRQIGGQANINTEEIRSIEIPLPPLDVQRKLVAKVNADRGRIAAWKQEADRKVKQARAEVEAMILGEKKPQGG